MSVSGNGPKKEKEKKRKTGMPSSSVGRLGVKRGFQPFKVFPNGWMLTSILQSGEIPTCIGIIG